MINEYKRRLLESLPAVGRVVEVMLSDAERAKISRSVLVSCVRASIEYFRSLVLTYDDSFECNMPTMNCIVEDVDLRISNVSLPGFRRVVNATGVVVHTNLGRSLISLEVIKNLTLVSSHYSNLEFDLSRGRRGARHGIIEPILCEITGAEAALVVNNNAAAILICLNTIASSKEVIISRGELVEIGDSFRIPDVMSKSGSLIKEVGTTNCTHIRDYDEAITDNTGLLMKVHTSNYSIVGFTASVSLPELVSLGKSKFLPVMEDLGSGTLVDFSKYGLAKEPTVQQSLISGVDIVTFSGDKLLGGPQAGIILGRKCYVERIKKNPLMRALRIDKMTLAALEATLRLYRDEREAVAKIPTLKMLLQCLSDISERAYNLCDKISSLFKFSGKKVRTKIFDMSSCAGGGALPLASFPSKCLGVRIEGLSVNDLEKKLRNNSIPIIVRIENGYCILDLRTIFRNEMDIIETAFKKISVNL